MGDKVLMGGLMRLDIDLMGEPNFDRLYHKLKVLLLLLILLYFLVTSIVVALIFQQELLKHPPRHYLRDKVNRNNELRTCVDNSRNSVAK